MYKVMESRGTFEIGLFFTKQNDPKKTKKRNFAQEIKKNYFSLLYCRMIVCFKLKYVSLYLLLY